MQTILKIKQAQSRIRLTINWLVECAKHPATRWEGVYELSPQSSFMSYYDRGKDTFKQRPALSHLQKHELRKALFAIDQMSYEDLGLVDLVAEEDDQEIVDFLIKKLKTLKPENTWFANSCMQRIVYFNNRTDLREILKKIEALDHLDKNYEKKQKKLIKEFIGLL